MFLEMHGLLTRLQTPDEILMSVVDTSASMRQPTDFSEVNEDLPMVEEVTALLVVEPEFYNRATFEDMRELLCKHESFDDMIGIITDAPYWHRTYTAQQVLETLRTMLGDDIIRKHKVCLQS
jgi:hypothetical protein